MSNLIKIHSTSAIYAVAKNPGRLLHDYEADPKSVVIKVNDALHKAALVMGLHPDAQTLAVTATEVVKKIMDTYPHAPVDDVLLAIQMASFGEIKLDNQLTTISAHNIYQWYKEFRYSHSHRTTAKVAPIVANAYPQPSESEKVRIVRDSFVQFVSDPKINDMTIDFQYQKLIEIGALEPSNEEKRNYYFREAHKVTQAPPMDFLKDRDKRKDVYAYQDRFKAQGDAMVFTGLESNALHKHIAEAAKRRMLIDFMSMADKDELITLFDKHYGK